ncbi:MAG: T9SS type A sorting domain-containing protein [Bacteroidales bacterium]
MKKLKLLLFGVLMLLTHFSYSDTEISFGGGYDYYPLRSTSYYNSSFKQALYTVEEIGSGELTGISLYYKGGYTSTFDNIRVYVKEIDGNEIPTDLIADGTLTYEGPFSVLSDQSGWVDIPFNKANFNVSGTKNVVICVNRAGTIQNGTYYIQWGTTAVSPENTAISKYGPYDPIYSAWGDTPKKRMALKFHGLDMHYGKITGTVTDYSGVPIENAIISESNFDLALTASDGTYEITDVPSNKMHTLSCNKNGYSKEVKKFFVDYDEEVVVDFKIDLPAASITPGKLYETMFPNEYRTSELTINNTGVGPFGWKAKIRFINNDGRGVKAQISPEYNPEEVESYEAILKNGLSPAPNVKKANSSQASPSMNRAEEYGIHASEYFAYSSFGTVSEAYAPQLKKYMDFPSLPDTNTITAISFPVGVDHFYYAMSRYGVCHKVDISDDIVTQKYMGQLVSDEDFGRYEITDMAPNPVNRKQYVITRDSLYEWNIPEMKLEPVGKLGIGNSDIALGIAIDRTGTAYVFCHNGRLFKVDVYTAEAEYIGKAGFTSKYFTSFHWDPVKDRFIGFNYNDTYKMGYLREVFVDGGGNNELCKMGETLYSGFAQPIKRFWLTLDEYSGNVEPNSFYSLGVNFDALNRTPGEMLTAEIEFTGDNGKISIIPVTMEITGDPMYIIDVEDMKATLKDAKEGVVKVEWVKSSDPSMHYKVVCNGEVVGTTTENFIMHDLPNYKYGVYYYWVTCVTADGKSSSPAGPAEIFWYAPEACDFVKDMEEGVWENTFEFVYYPIKNCGSGLLKFEFPEFANENEVNFISEVVPQKGEVYPGETKYVRFKYDALPPSYIGEEAWPVGTYTTKTTVITNSVNDEDKEFKINHKMIVYKPKQIIGQVRDGNTNERLSGVRVKAVDVTDVNIEFITETDDDGRYVLKADEGDYELFFAKPGYQPVYEAGPFAAGDDDDTVVDVLMFEMPYAPGYIHATIDQVENGHKFLEGNHCDIEWSLPWGAYELLYDDGTAEKHVIGLGSNSAGAVRFTPMGYPTVITGAKFNVGDGTFPKGSNFLNTKVKVGVYFPDKDTGMPKAKPEAEKVVEVKNLGWVEYNGIFNVKLEKDKDGYPENFFIVVTQVEKAGNAAPIAVDRSEPIAYQSYVRNDDNGWTFASIQDLMIRALVEGADDGQTPPAKSSKISTIELPEGKFFKSDGDMKSTSGYRLPTEVVARANSRDVVNYTMERIHVQAKINPNKTNWKEDPKTVLVNKKNVLNFKDAQWKSLPQGYYAYRVKSHFTNGDESDWTYTKLYNMRPHKLVSNVVVDVELKFGSDEEEYPGSMIADSTEITLTGLNFPYVTHYREIFEITDTPEKSIAYFPKESELLKFPKEASHKWFEYGDYMLNVFKIGFDKYKPTMPFEIYQPNFKIDVALQQKKYRVRGLVVDPLTSVATWPKARITELYEDFEGLSFPPAGWYEYTIADVSPAATRGWFLASNDNATYWNNFPSPRFIVPERDGFWAEVNEDYNGSNSNASLDYLITPEIDLRESEDYGVEFDQYFTGAESSRGYVEFSIDNGENWYVLGEVDSKSEWHSVRFDIDDMVLNGPINFNNYGSEDPNEGKSIKLDGKDGQRKVRFAFHYWDDHQYSTGWAIDNVSIVNGAPNFESYEVSLNDSWQGEVDKDPFEGEYDTGKFHWWFPNLIYGQIYTAGVKGKYASGLSEADKYTWKSTYLIPPYVFDGKVHDQENVLTWHSPRFWVKGDKVDHATGAIDPSGAIPDNLIGFNLYRNDDDPVFIERDDEGLPYAFADGVEPGEYEYYITAVYDLTPYGLSTKTGESQMVGPIVLELAWGFELPFFEDWGTGAFDLHLWTGDGENWKIDPYSGKDLPCSQFDFMPKQMNYSKGLTTKPINGVGTVFGDIYLEYDIKLDVANPTGTEKLRVQIGQGKDWVDLETYKNDASFDWGDRKKMKITNMLAGKVLQIRFLAEGENTTNIRSWYIDNVHIYRECPKPYKLSWKVFHESQDVNNDKNGVELTWSLATLSGQANKWIKHPTQETMTDFYSFPTTSGEVLIGARYTPKKLKDLAGAKFDKVRAVLGAGVSTAEVRIYEGNAQVPGGAPLSSKTISMSEVNLNGEYTVWDLDDAVEIKENTYYYLVYFLNINENQPAIGIDAGPMVNDKYGIGSMITIGDKPSTLIDATAAISGFNYNWMIGAHITGESAGISSGYKFDIYRTDYIDGVMQEEKKIELDLPLKAPYMYFDEQDDDKSPLLWGPGSQYYYRVVAKISSHNDKCEGSAYPHKDSLATPYGYVGMNDLMVSDNLMVYPNPTEDKLHIVSNEVIDRVQVVSALGQLIHVEDVNSDKHDLDMSSQPAGLYLIKIEMNEKVVIKKITVK